MQGKTRYNITRIEYEADRNIGVPSPVICFNTHKAIGNVKFPDGKTFKQRLAMIHRRFGSNTGFGPEGHSYEEWKDLAFAWEVK